MEASHALFGTRNIPSFSVLVKGCPDAPCDEVGEPFKAWPDISMNSPPKRKSIQTSKLLPTFFREEGFALTKTVGRPSRLGKPGRSRFSARQVIGEVIREQHLVHVPKPQPPIHLHGHSAEELVNWFEEEHMPAAKAARIQTVGGRTRKQRSDTPTLVGAVCSYPVAGISPDDPDVHRWTQAVIDMAQQVYPGAVKSVFGHQDEAFWHVHIIAAMDGSSVKRIMAGHSAAAQAARAGSSRREQQAAFKAACSRLQDRVWAMCGEPFGLTRSAPEPRPRRARAAHLLIKQEQQRDQEKALALKEDELELRSGAVEKRLTDGLFEAQAEAAAIKSEARQWADAAIAEARSKSRAILERADKVARRTQDAEAILKVAARTQATRHQEAYSELEQRKVQWLRMLEAAGLNAAEVQTLMVQHGLKP
jgi:hypothetical protein